MRVSLTVDPFSASFPFCHTRIPHSKCLAVQNKNHTVVLESKQIPLPTNSLRLHKEQQKGNILVGKLNTLPPSRDTCGFVFHSTPKQRGNSQHRAEVWLSTFRSTISFSFLYLWRGTTHSSGQRPTAPASRDAVW